MEFNHDSELEIHSFGFEIFFLLEMKWNSSKIRLQGEISTIVIAASLKLKALCLKDLFI